MTNPQGISEIINGLDPILQLVAVVILFGWMAWYWIRENKTRVETSQARSAIDKQLLNRIIAQDEILKSVVEAAGRTNGMVEKLGEAVREAERSGFEGVYALKKDVRDSVEGLRNAMEKYLEEKLTAHERSEDLQLSSIGRSLDDLKQEIRTQRK